MYIKQNVNIFLKKNTKLIIWTLPNFSNRWLLFIVDLHFISSIDLSNVTQEGILLYCISSLLWCGDISNNSEDIERY